MKKIGEAKETQQKTGNSTTKSKMNPKQFSNKDYILINLSIDSNKDFNISKIIDNYTNYDIILCANYIPPPKLRALQITPSGIVLVRFAIFCDIQKQLNSLEKRSPNLYHILNVYFNKLKLNRFIVFEKGIPQKNTFTTKNFSCVIPHKGDIGLLYRCLSGLEKSEFPPDETLIYFDDDSYYTFKQSHNLKLKLFRNNPSNQGPYSARNHGCLNSTYDIAIHHDSDDLSLPKRFNAIVSELSNTDADVVGSHELRINEIEQSVIIVKYPIEVNEAWKKKYTFAQLHPTTGILKQSHIKSGGFSTHITYALDTQFQMRAFLKGLKFRNVNQILYVRFIRFNSLTTNNRIGLNSKTRTKFIEAWSEDFSKIQLMKIKLENSTLEKLENPTIEEPIQIK